MNSHSRATSIGTKRALSRLPRCKCTVCLCRRYAAGTGSHWGEIYTVTSEKLGFNRKMCAKCGHGKHTKRIRATIIAELSK